MMSDRLSDRDTVKADGPRDGPARVEAVTRTLNAALSVNTEVQRLILAYALGAAIVAVLPSSAWYYEIKLVIVLVLIGFMTRGIGRRWAGVRGRGALTLVMTALGLVGALAITAMVFMIVFAVSLFVPLTRGWAEAAAYFALTLAAGRVANDYFQGARRVDRDRLARRLARRPGRPTAVAGENAEESGRSGWNRRRLLLAGLAGTLAVKGAADHSRWRRTRSELADRADQYDDPFEAAYATKAAWQEEVRSILAVRGRAAITPPQIPYDRAIARQLIFACKTAVMQYRTGLATSGYRGDVTELKAMRDAFGESERMATFIAGERAFRDFFGPAEQRATFVAEQEFFEDYFEVLNPPPDGAIRSPVQRLVRPIEDLLFEVVPKLVRRMHRRPVFVGYVLATERANLVVFRGTQTSDEWLHNLRSGQRRFAAPGSGASFGWIHGGFLAVSELIRPSPAEIAEQLDPSKPCYIAGHSLGSALATIWALKLALANPALAAQIRLYCYAGPRVGDPIFAERFSALLPNTYRIVNLADGVPLVPTSNMGRTFVHVGQEVSFVGNFGDLLLNHVVDAYEYALAEGVETVGIPSQLPILTAPEWA